MEFPVLTWHIQTPKEQSCAHYMKTYIAILLVTLDMRVEALDMRVELVTL